MGTLDENKSELFTNYEHSLMNDKLSIPLLYTKANRSTLNENFFGFKKSFTRKVVCKNKLYFKFCFFLIKRTLRIFG